MVYNTRLADMPPEERAIGSLVCLDDAFLSSSRSPTWTAEDQQAQWAFAQTVAKALTDALNAHEGMSFDPADNALRYGRMTWQPEVKVYRPLRRYGCAWKPADYEKGWAIVVSFASGRWDDFKTTANTRTSYSGKATTPPPVAGLAEWVLEYVKRHHDECLKNARWRHEWDRRSKAADLATEDGTLPHGVSVKSGNTGFDVMVEDLSDEDYARLLAFLGTLLPARPASVAAVTGAEV